MIADKLFKRATFRRHRRLCLPLQERSIGDGLGPVDEWFECRCFGKLCIFSPLLVLLGLTDL